MRKNRFHITILSDKNSWKNPHLQALATSLKKKGHTANLIHYPKKVKRGDILFLIGLTKLIPPEILGRNRHNIVVHESALPKGRGWSPLSWQILEGRNKIPISLCEAANKVDSGVVYLRKTLKLKGHELAPEWRLIAGNKIVSLVHQFVKQFPRIGKKGQIQKGKATYYKRRTPEDLELNPRKSLASQFPMLRIADNERYPAFFKWRKRRYRLKVEREERFSS
ncbi:hypothetical protein BVX98_03825 [bacterium F11]|nr:hypothetical protein BVX98_03825 [bacterium F11]